MQISKSPYDRRVAIPYQAIKFRIHVVCTIMTFGKELRYEDASGDEPLWKVGLLPENQELLRTEQCPDTLILVVDHVLEVAGLEFFPFIDKKG